MAFQPQTIPTLFTRSFQTATRFASPYFHPSISSFPFSTLQIPHNYITTPPPQNHSTIDESHVLNQLSDLLPIKQTPPPNQSYEEVYNIYADADSRLPNALVRYPSLGPIMPDIKSVTQSELIQQKPTSINPSVDSFLPPNQSYENSDNDCRPANATLVRYPSLGPTMPEVKPVTQAELIRRKPISTNPSVDSFLPPEDKLRGIFLQKFRSKNAIRKALDSVGVELNADLVAKVVNKGNLSGEKMILFFNWAIEQPNVPKSIDLYHVILKALGRRKFFKHMVEMLREMRGVSAVKPNSETLFVVLDSFIRVRQVSKAMQIFGNMEEFGLKCDTETLNVMLRCLSRRGHVGAACSLVSKMKGKVAFDIMTYNVVIGGWSRLGRVCEVERFLGEMVEGGFDPDNLTYSYILEGLGRVGKVDDAVEVFETLEEKGCSRLDAAVYNSMISNFIAVSNINECLKYYERMLSNKCEPNMDTYSRIISAFLEARRVADALEMFDDMLARGIIPTTGTITSFLETLCSYGPPHAALMIYKKARKFGCRISLSAYKLLLMRLSRFGKCGMLLNIWDEMQESGYSSDMEVYEYVINGLCNIGQLENAVLVMEEALRKGFFPRKLICSKLNNKLLSANKIETAYKLFLKMKVARGNENARRYWRVKGWHF